MVSPGSWALGFRSPVLIVYPVGILPEFPATGLQQVTHSFQKHLQLLCCWIHTPEGSMLMRAKAVLLPLGQRPLLAGALSHVHCELGAPSGLGSSFRMGGAGAGGSQGIFVGGLCT